jgi:hypothetical protein
VKAEKRHFLWPEIAIAACWIGLFLLTDFVFRDDESLFHRVAHLGLWLSLVGYLVVVLREHRMTEP